MVKYVKEAERYEKVRMSKDYLFRCSPPDQVKILFAGIFNLHLNDWKGNIEYNGGSVTSNLEESDVAVLPDQTNYQRIQYLKK